MGVANILILPSRIKKKILSYSSCHFIMKGHYNVQNYEYIVLSSLIYSQSGENVGASPG